MPRRPPALVAAGLILPHLTPPARPWSDKASLSCMALAGNAEGQTFGFGNEFRRAWGGANLALDAGGARVVSTTTVATATGDAPDRYRMVETRATTVPAESYYPSGRYDHPLADGLFWQVGAGWDRNVPSGIRARGGASLGAGRWWVKNDRTQFRTDLGFGWARTVQVDPQPDFRDRSWVWNLNAEYARTGADAGFTCGLQASLGMGDRVWLASLKNAYTANLSRRLALKLGLNLNYTTRPAWREVDVLREGSDPPEVIGRARVPLKRLDAVYTTSLVITF